MLTVNMSLVCIRKLWYETDTLCRESPRIVLLNLLKRTMNVNRKMLFHFRYFKL